jgi:hypothetical protein
LYISIEATSISSVAASGALLANFHYERILITVGQDFFDNLSVTRGRALVPDLLTAAGKVDGFAYFQRSAKRFLVHVGNHENFVGVGIL